MIDLIKSFITSIIAEPYLQPFWDDLLERTTDNEIIWYVIGLNVWAAFVYWTHGIIYVLMDVFKKPKFMQKYKIRENDDRSIDWVTFKEVACVVLYNQFIVGISFSIVFYYVGTSIKSLTPTFKTAPTFLKFILDFFVLWLTREISFYYLHRLLHYGKLYVLFHKKHHTWTAPISISSEYCTGMEHILTNIIPASVGPVIMHSSYITIVVWYYFLMASTVHKHSGYDIPWYYNTTRRHEAHHEKFNVNYGLIGLMDWIHGTGSERKCKKLL